MEIYEGQVCGGSCKESSLFIRLRRGKEVNWKTSKSTLKGATLPGCQRTGPPICEVKLFFLY